MLSIDVSIDATRSFEHFYYAFATAIIGTFATAIIASPIPSHDSIVTAST
jgi:hypothetical protein